jgi:hypothetical protein
MHFEANEEAEAEAETIPNAKISNSDFISNSLKGYLISDPRRRIRKNETGLN